MEKIQDLTGWSSDDFAGISHAARHTRNATSATDGTKPVLLGWCNAAGGGLDLDRGENCYALANHLGCNYDSAPADQVSGSTGKTKSDKPTSAGVWQAAYLVAKQARVRAGANGQPDALLQVGLGIGHIYARCCRAK